MKKLTDKITFRNGGTITNRLLQSPMLTNSGLDEMVTQETIDYYTAHSRSAGVVVVEYTSVSPNGGPSRSWARDREQLAVYDDKFMPGLAKVAAGLKKDGNKALLQLVHSGREANYRAVLGGRVEVPSQMDFPWLTYPVYELTEEETWQIVRDFGAATKRAIDCGFDGIEIHGANHYLIQEFFSAFSNHRTDFFGGSLEKRMNFPIEVSREVFRVVKEYAPKDFIVGYRISPEEIHGENVGYTWHESQQLVAKLTELFDFDYIHLSTLDYKCKPELNDSEKTLAELLGEAVKAPALEVVTGGITSYEQMVDCLNYADIVGLGRMTLMDPQIGWKIENGMPDQIRTRFTEEGLLEGRVTIGTIETLAGIVKSLGLDTPGSDVLIKMAGEDLDSSVIHA